MGSDNVFGRKFPLYVSAMVLLFVSALTAYAWIKLPADTQVPNHWGIDGNVDGYGSKAFGLLLNPGIIVFVLAFFFFLSALEPRWEHLRQSRKALDMILISLLVLLSIVHSMLVWTALGHSVNVFVPMSVCIGALLCVFGNYLGKVRSNFFLGVRTRWTLSSELSWNKSNRLRGKLMVACGLLIIATALTLGPRATVVVVVASALSIVPITVVYSYWIWKSDPDRKGTSRSSD